MPFLKELNLSLNTCLITSHESVRYL
jgi:hypothetical protein